MGASQRRKGHNFERLIAAKIREIGVETRRGNQTWRADPLAEKITKEPDIVCGPPLDDVWIECKCGARPNVWTAMGQAVSDAPPGQTPIVIAHRDRGRTLVCYEIEDWLELISRMGVSGD